MESAMTTKLTVEQVIQKEHVWLMKNPKYCFYSGIIMIGKTEVVDDIPTACTNGRDTMYGRDFMAKLSVKEVRAVILHENLHKAFRHLTMWKHLYKEQPRIANMACDYVINLMIYDSDPKGVDVKLPDCALLDEQYRGLDAGEVYRRLKKKCEEEGRGRGGQGEGEPLDDHGWDDAEEMTQEEKEQLAKDIDQGLRQGAILAGKMSANVPREISELTEAKVDWREALREFVTSFCQERDTSTWRRPSRRWIGQDVYMPSSIGESVGRMVVAIDMSGSIGQHEVGAFLTELREICKTVTPEGIDLLYWDTQVCQHEKYEREDLENLLNTTKPRGGGGTAPQCIVDYMKAKRLKPECAVVLTDGIVSDWGTGWDCPTLWGVTTKGISSDVGKTVHVQ
jgi:predicted metal-dependent peptidase